jgi:hypothetical protein
MSSCLVEDGKGQERELLEGALHRDYDNHVGNLN